MPSINLLPWREEERKRRQTEFLIAMAAAFVFSLVTIFLVNVVYDSKIDYQRERNSYLEEQIVELQKSITAIDGLELQKERLLARMEVITRLQRSRPEIVHLFDEIAHQIPEGVFLTGMKQTGSAVELKGNAQSSTRVSALMRRVDSSPWLSDPDVVKVETTAQSGSRQAEFIVNLKQVRENAEEGDEG
jgi:type IV pilus assembly protein PilN